MTIEPGARTWACVVCGDAVEPSTSSECNGCNGRYHLNQRNDIEGKDCGRVWIDEQFLALQFACDNCLPPDMRDDIAPGARPAAPAPPRTEQERPPRTRRYKRRA